VAYSSERLRRVGTRTVTLGLYELNLTDDEKRRLSSVDDPESAFADILTEQGQTVNRVVRASAPTGPIFFPEGPAPIVAHVEFPEEVTSMWIVTLPSGGGEE
jgi:hypothetical protein